MSLTQLVEWVKSVPSGLPEEMRPMAESICEAFQSTAKRLMDLGLGYLTMDRSASTLSTGERQRMQLARAVRNRTTGVLYVLDEPSIGLHPSNIVGLTGVMHDLVADGNSVILVDHDTQILKEADWIVEMGPEAGAKGGYVIAQGAIPAIEANSASQIGPFLAGTAETKLRCCTEKETLFANGTIHLSTNSIHTVKPLEVQTTLRNFNALVREMNRINNVTNDFVSSVSHEFKTPLTAIEGYAMLLQDTGLTQAERDEYLDKILYNTHRLSTLVGNILMLSKLENQSLSDQRSTFRLDEQLRQAVVMLEPQWEEKSLSFRAELDAVSVTACEPLLLQVWTNLIGNAIKFSEPGQELSLRLLDQTECAVVSVTDHGCGMTPEVQARIFEKFYQGDSSRKAMGNGLGQVLIQAQGARDGARDARDLQRVRHACAVVIALRLQEDLRLVHKAAEGLAVQDAVGVPLIAGPHVVFLRLLRPRAAARGIGKLRTLTEAKVLGPFQFFPDRHRHFLPSVARRVRSGKRERAVFLFSDQPLDRPGRKVGHPLEEALCLLLRQQQIQLDIRAELRLADHAAECGDLEADALIPAVGARQIDIRPDALDGAPCGVHGDLGPVSIGAHKAARAEQDAAEIARHDARYIVKLLPLQHLQHRHTRRAARLAVIGKARCAIADDVGVDVVGRIPVLLAHLLQPRERLLLRLRQEDVSDEAGAALDELRLAVAGGDEILLHASGSFTKRFRRPNSSSRQTASTSTPSGR